MFLPPLLFSHSLSYHLLTMQQFWNSYSNTTIYLPAEWHLAAETTQFLPLLQKQLRSYAATSYHPLCCCTALD